MTLHDEIIQNLTEANKTVSVERLTRYSEITIYESRMGQECRNMAVNKEIKFSTSQAGYHLPNKKQKYKLN